MLLQKLQQLLFLKLPINKENILNIKNLSLKFRERFFCTLRFRNQIR